MSSKMRARLYSTAIALSIATRSLAAQPSSVPPVPAPLRELPWGQLNFLHTTDSHGWLAGHLQEPSYGADWGDYISFAERLQERADGDGSDLLLIDTGDRIEGNGLYDADHPKGKYILSIFGKQDIALLCSGNHELYKNNSSYDELQITVPQSHGNYIASNIDIFDPETKVRRPLAQRYKIFVTKNQGIRVLAFGFLYDFNINSNNTVVQHVADTIKEEWFQDAIRQADIDLFLVIGHVALRTSEFHKIFQAIRQQNWDAPIHFFGGHLHIRDYAKYDSKAYAIESGRYMETIGFASISGLNGAKTSSITSHNNRAGALEVTEGTMTLKSPTFARRYIDNNLFSFHHHTGLNSSTFATPRGNNVSQLIAKDRRALKLDRTYGCAPQTYWTDRAPYPGQDSIFTWLQQEVMPYMRFEENNTDKAKIVLTNSGAIRFDIFEGKFTVDTIYTISPFTSGFRHIPDVPLDVAARLSTVLNMADHIWPAMPRMASKVPEFTTFVANGPARDVHGGLKGQSPLIGTNQNADLTPGYTTVDDAGSDGDDTEHSTIKRYKAPNCLESRISFPSETEGTAPPETVDLIYVDFIERYILLALKFLGTDYSEEDSAVYTEGQTLTSVIQNYVKQNWPCDGQAASTTRQVG